MIAPPSTAIILPPREGFSPSTAGAVALWVHESLPLEVNSTKIRIFGKVVDNPFTPNIFHSVSPLGWIWQRQRDQYIKAIVRELSTFRPTIIEIHNRPIFIPLFQKALATSGYTPLYSVFFHNDPQDMEYAKTPQQRAHLLTQCCAIYCVSNYIRSRFMEGLDSYNASHVYTVTNGVDLERFSSHQISKENIILYVGRIVPEKGVLTFLNALERVLPSAPDWKALLVGRARHGGGKESAFEKTVKENLERINRHTNHRVEWLSFLPYDAVVELYKKAAITAVPSEWQEPFGRTAIEAMAAGCALVTTSQGGLYEIAHKVAPLFPASDGIALARILLDLMNDATKRESVQKRCLERAADFDLTKIRQLMAEVREQRNVPH